MSKVYNTTSSRFFCTKCGREGIPVHRKKGQEREDGHLKKLYCMYCQEEVNHVEIKEYGNYTVDDFKQEYELGRFINGERIEKKDLIECSNIDCPFNVDGRCWNSNYSNDCGHRIQKEVDENG